MFADSIETQQSVKVGAFEPKDILQSKFGTKGYCESLADGCRLQVNPTSDQLNYGIVVSSSEFQKRTANINHICIL